jgi:hypothetical protein
VPNFNLYLQSVRIWIRINFWTCKNTKLEHWWHRPVWKSSQKGEINRKPFVDHLSAERQAMWLWNSQQNPGKIWRPWLWPGICKFCEFGPIGCLT